MMGRGPRLRSLGLVLGLLALAGLAAAVVLQHRALSRWSERNRALQSQLGELDRLRAEAAEVQKLRNQEAELQQLREDNRDLLKLRNEVHQLREQVKEIDALRSANARLLQSLQSASLTSNQQAMVVATRKEGAVLGVFALSANDPRAGPSASARYNGAIIMTIDASAPAARSGLAVGDIIVRVDGRMIDSVGQLQSEMLTHKPGDIVTLDVMRKDTLVRIPVQTRAWP